MFRKRLAKLEAVQRENPHAAVEIKKRLLQTAALSVALIGIIDRDGVPWEAAPDAPPSNLPEFAVGGKQIVYVDVDDLKPNACNPDITANVRQLRSMLDDGFTVPILVHQQTGEIVDGEHRWRAARQLATEGIPSENIAPQPQLRLVPVVYV